MPGQYTGGYPTGITRGGCEVADSIEDKEVGILTLEKPGRLYEPPC
jgi:hypothetical protein